MHASSDISIHKNKPLNAGYLLCVSDLHIGSPHSAYDHEKDIQRLFLQAVQRSKHVILNGDIFELYDIPNRNRTSIMGAIKSADATLRQWLDNNPNTQFHFVLGNHENVKRFRHILGDIAEDYPERFEWHPEAIKIGNSLFTHGDLQTYFYNTDKTRPLPRMKDICHEQVRDKFVPLFERPAKSFVKQYYSPERMANITSKHLEKRATHGSQYANTGKAKLEKKVMYYNESGVPALFTNDTLADIHHVFTGHTHMQFMQRLPNQSHVRQISNTGGVTEGFDDSLHKLGFIAAELDEAGAVDSLISYRDFLNLADKSAFDGPGNTQLGRWQQYIDSSSEDGPAAARPYF